MKPKISIVTATLNRKDLLPRCIEAVAGQSYPDKEHIIIDGGSKDGTVERIKSYAQEYSHIRWISEKDNGISSALNRGLAMATGDIIGVCGDDDFYEPGAFQIVADEFDQNPSVSVVSGNCECIRNDGTAWGTLKSSFTNRRSLIEYWRYWNHEVYLPAQATFFRKDVIDVVGGFDENDRYAMDYRHWIKITEKFSVKTIDRTLAKFRWDEGTVSCSRGKEQLAEMCAISKRYWGSMINRDFYHLAFSYFKYCKWRPFMQRVQNSFEYRTQPLKQR